MDINMLRRMSLMQGFNSPENIMGGQVGMGPFSPPNFPEQPQPQQMPPPMPVTPFQGSGGGNDDVMAMFNNYQPDTSSRDRFNRLLDTMPQREEPNWARRLVASGMGVGSKDPIGTMENVMYAPYMRDITAWKEKTQPYAQAAQLENTANVNERQLRGNMASVQGAQNKLESQERIQTERNNINRIKAYAAQLKAQRYEIKILGSRVVGFGPNGERQDLGTSNGMDELDKLELQNAGKVAAAEATGTAAVNRIQASGTDILQDPSTGKRYRSENGILVQVEGGPSGPLNRVGTPSNAGVVPAKERREEQQLRYGQILGEHPEYGKFFDEKEDGTLTPKRRPSYTLWSRDKTDEAEMAEWDIFNQLINPNYKPPVKGGGAPSPSPTPTPTPQLTPIPGRDSASPTRYQLPQPTPEPKGLAPSYLPGQGPQRGEQQRHQLAPPPPKDTTIAVFDSNGRLAGYIENTPGQIESAAAQGLRPHPKRG